MSAITIRPAAAADINFLFGLHAAAMRAYVEQTFGPWQEDWQFAYYRKHFHLADLRILQLDGQDIGMIQIQERSEEIYLANIEILPEFQGRGIGTAFLKTLLAQAEQLGLPVALKVLKVNHRARHLYQRLGFGVTGEDQTHYIMATLKK